jgi:hypothetical protein
MNRTSPSTRLRRLALPCALALAPPAPSQVELAPPVPVAPGGRLAAVHVDAPGDGYVWVLAPGYKARFGRDGATFYPYFGARAPRTYPCHFAMRSVACGDVAMPFAADVAPLVEGLRIRYARGAVTEVWDLRSDAAEQSFIVDPAQPAGDLTVRLAVATELAATDTDDGLHFAHATLGHVHYGDVLAFDAHGQRCVSPSRLCEGGIELRVPHAAVAAMRGPITIDPVVRAISVDAGSDVVGDAEVAFEPTTGHWLVAYVRFFATTDTDIITRRFDFAGTLQEEVVVATGSRESGNPSVGANAAARQFLVAWDEDTSVADRVILGRTRAAAGTTQGSTFTVLDTSGVGNDDVFPRVGGSFATDATGSVYGVSCLSDSSVGRILSFVRVTTGGSATRVATLSANGQVVTSHRLTRARGNGDPWLCTYLVQQGASIANLHAATAPASGSAVQRLVVDPSFACGLGGVAGGDGEYLAVYSLQVAAGNSDIMGRVLRLGSSGLTLGPGTNLTAGEPGASVAVNQIFPTVGFDGVRYTYAYQETVGSAGSFDVFAAVVSVRGFAFSAGHQPLHATTAENESVPEIASAGEMGGEVARAFISFTRQVSGNPDVAGVLFDGTSAQGGVTTVRTACGGHTLVAENEPALGAVLRLRAAPTQPTSQVFLIGLRAGPLRLCAAGCSLGVTPILATVPGANLDLPIPTGTNLLGAEFAVQNVLVGRAGGCAAPDTPLPLLTSPTLVVVVR